MFVEAGRESEPSLWGELLGGGSDGHGEQWVLWPLCLQDQGGWSLGSWAPTGSGWVEPGVLGIYRMRRPEDSRTLGLHQRLSVIISVRVTVLILLFLLFVCL